jgi:hypothetical protein|nr:MAG TPA: helix-turn-helix domain protein [Caudoviricetes sp.]
MPPYLCSVKPKNNNKMQEIRFIQVTPNELTELIREGVRKELQMFDRLKGTAGAGKDGDLLTIEQTADLLRVSKGTVKNLTKKKILTSYGIGRRLYWKRNEVNEALTRLTPANE